MKKYLLTILTIVVSLFFLGNNLFCQITTIPEYPSDQDLITLTFDATGTALENYTGEVYAHTGVILEGSPDWTHVWTEAECIVRRKVRFGNSYVFVGCVQHFQRNLFLSFAGWK